MEELVMLPMPLLLTYAGILLASGAVLGGILMRNLRRAGRTPQELPLERRVQVLESEVEASQRELAALAEENEFLRQLQNGSESDS